MKLSRELKKQALWIFNNRHKMTDNEFYNECEKFEKAKELYNETHPGKFKGLKKFNESLSDKFAKKAGEKLADGIVRFLFG